MATIAAGLQCAACRQLCLTRHLRLVRSGPNWRYDLDKGPSPRGNWAPGLDPGAEPLAGAWCLWVANPGAVAARAGKQQCVLQGVSSWAAYAIQPDSQPTTGLAASPYGDRRFWPLPNCRLTAGILHKTGPNAPPTAPWPMGLGWGVSGDNLSATFMPRLCVYGRLLALAHTGAGATGIGR